MRLSCAACWGAASMTPAVCLLACVACHARAIPVDPHPHTPTLLQRIPNEVDLPAIVPAPLVKPTPPAGLKPTADEQQTMFTSVVPDSRCDGLR